MRTRTCWCRLCQALGGGSATVNVCFPTEGFAITGETADYVSLADSGARMHRRFCPRCGTPLFSEAEPRPHLIFVRAGALKDREIAAPTATIWTSEAPSWACIDPDIPRVEGQPPPVA
ncbi:MAG TPA: GFA family protein [Caulobacteraceae bacterium]|nr:GFA family protein [Caulobacteraceae bacterium]